VRGAFSYIEVLIAVAILAFLGVALLKFNSFNARAMERNIHSQENLLLSSGLLFEKKSIEKKDIRLFDVVKFSKLKDNDRKFLQSIMIHVSSKPDDKIFLGNDGKKNLYLEYGNMRVQYKTFVENYLWLQKAK